MRAVAERVLRAISEDLEAHGAVLDVAGVLEVQITVRLDAAGCPREVRTLTETRRQIERIRPVKQAG